MLAAAGKAIRAANPTASVPGLNTAFCFVPRARTVLKPYRRIAST